MWTFPNSSLLVIAPKISPETRMTFWPSFSTTVNTPEGSLFNPNGSLLPCLGPKYLSHPVKSLPLNNCFHSCSAPAAHAAHTHKHRPANLFITSTVVPAAYWKSHPGAITTAKTVRCNLVQEWVVVSLLTTYIQSFKVVGRNHPSLRLVILLLGFAFLTNAIAA